MTKAVILTVRRDFAASPERVFDAWLDPELAGKFLFATPDGRMTTVEIDARVGGDATIIEQRGDAEAVHRLRYELIERPRRLTFLFKACMAGGDDAGDWTRVAITIEPTATGSALTLTHEMAPDWAAHEERTRQGWTMILGGLADIVESNDG